jgi:hypothetical protein
MAHDRQRRAKDGEACGTAQWGKLSFRRLMERASVVYATRTPTIVFPKGGSQHVAFRRDDFLVRKQVFFAGASWQI